MNSAGWGRSWRRLQPSVVPRTVSAAPRPARLTTVRGYPSPARRASSLVCRRPPSPPSPRRMVSAASPGRAYSTTPSPPPPPFAFAFDIDGVLLHVNDPIPGAAAALRFLHAKGIPFILLTNGGGRYEADRVADLQRRLGLDCENDGHGAGSLPVLSTANFVQSHTPFQELIDNIESLDPVGPPGALPTPPPSPAASSTAVPPGFPRGLRDQTILVTGSDAARARTIAQRYGFQSVVTPADLLVAYPDLWPFDPLLASVYQSTAQPLPKPLLLEGGKRPILAAGNADPALDPSQYLRIAAAFVFNDPRDWALDIQILTDLLQARHGFLGTFDPASLAPPAGSQTTSQTGDAQQQTRLFFSNGDLLWATTYHLPRFGQGAFAAALSGVWAQLAHGQLLVDSAGRGGRATLLGKPNPATYRFAERVLLRYRDTVLGGHPAGTRHTPPLQTVYMVGDNPASDIAGANQFHSAHGTDWCSVLVGTGVYNAARDGADAAKLRHRPRVIVDDVAAAVKWALQREGWAADF